MVSHDLPHTPTARSIDQGNVLDEEEILRTIEFYEEEVARRTEGPQLEGIETNSLAEALRSDPNVVLIDVMKETGEVIKWPLLVPIEYHIDYSKNFFDEHYPDQPSYAFSLPPHASIEDLLRADEFSALAARLKSENAIIAYDFLDGSENADLIPEFIRQTLMGTAELEDITPNSKMDGIEYGLPKVAHYEGFVQAANPSENPAPNLKEAFGRLIEQGEIAKETDEGIMCLTAEMLDKDGGQLFEQVWNIYSDQFNILTEDHPSLQKQPKEELKRMLLDEDSINIAYMADGKVTGLLYFVHQMEKCVWLNKGFYDERYPEEKGWLAYYPGIVVAKEKAHQGLGYAQKMIATVCKAMEETNQEMIVTCQCTNVSMTYVTQMVENVVNSQPGLRVIPNEDGGLGFKKVAQYEYRVAQVI